MENDTVPAETEIGECCSKCRFFLPTELNQGMCRRYPATAMPIIQGGYATSFPVMLDAGWCGEFQAVVA